MTNLITAKVIADTTYNEHRVTTLELEYPRYIHSELMTHRVFSRNAASSRAIPISRMIELIKSNKQVPMWTGKQSGMQGATVDDLTKKLATDVWDNAMHNAIASATALDKLGIHKQNANRLLEPFQTMKTIITGTDWDNFFKLRIHPAAQPEIQMLAEAIKIAIDESEPIDCSNIAGFWHLPYMKLSDVTRMGWDKAKKISASCCAQVSYRKLDTSDDKALGIFDKLISGDIIHGSAFEHICRPMEPEEKQVGNLTGFRQYRHDIEQELGASHLSKK